MHHHHSIIARKLSCNKIENKYVSIFAHDKYIKRCKKSSHFSKYNEFLSNLISEKLNLNWSLEQIFNAFLNGKLSFKTIYNWIYIGKLKGISFKILRYKGKRRKNKISCSNKKKDRTAPSMLEVIKKLVKVLPKRH